MAEPGTSKTVQCVVVTPEKAILDAAVEFVALPLFDGELGVLPGRAALIGRLGCGELRTRSGNSVQRWFVDGGFAQVRDNVVTVLTPRALPAGEIDLPAANRVLETALAPAASPQSLADRQRAQDRARAQIRVAQRGHGQTHH